MKKLTKKLLNLVLALVMIVSVLPADIFASGSTNIQMEFPTIEDSEFEKQDNVEVYSKSDGFHDWLNIKENAEYRNTLKVTSDKFSSGGVLGFGMKQYLGKAMNIWIPDLNNDKDKQRIVDEEGITNGVEQSQYVAKKFKEATEKWDETDWDFDESYYQLKVKLPKYMTFDKDEIISKWNLDINGVNPDSFLESLYDPQEVDIQGNTIIFRAKFKTLDADIALNTQSENWNKQILKVSIPVDVQYKKDTNIFEYAVELEHSVRIVDKSGELLIEGSADNKTDWLRGPLFPMDISGVGLEAFSAKQYIEGDIAIGSNSENNNFYVIDKNRTFDITTKLNISPIKKTVADPFSAMGFPTDKHTKWSEIETFRFWPALDLDTELSAILRFPKQIIVPDNIDRDSLQLLGSENIFYISEVERSTDPLTEETILKVYMPLTDNAKRDMPSLYTLSNVIDRIRNTLYLKVPGLKLSDIAEYNQHYTLEATVGGKLFFTFITDIDDWVASEYTAELQNEFGQGIVQQDTTYAHVFHFNLDHPKLSEAVDYVFDKHPELFSDVIPDLLTDESARKKYDTNVYSSFVAWVGKQEEGGRDYLYLQNNGNPDDITFTLLAKKPAVPGGGTGGGAGGRSTPTPQPQPQPQNPKKDNDAVGKLNTVDHYAYMAGYPDGTFRADVQMTRAEVAMMFARLLKDRPDGTPFMSDRYSDVIETNWYSYAVDYMSEQNIIKGYPDGTFRPNAPITRAEFAAISARFDNLANIGNITFIDVDEDHWAGNVITKAATKGWVSGYPDGTFKPNQNITRAEVVSSTNRILNRYADLEFAKAHKEELAPMTDISETHWAYGAIVEAMNGHDYIRLADGKAEKWGKLNGKSFDFPVSLPQ